MLWAQDLQLCDLVHDVKYDLTYDLPTSFSLLSDLSLSICHIYSKMMSSLICHSCNTKLSLLLLITLSILKKVW